MRIEDHHIVFGTVLPFLSSHSYYNNIQQSFLLRWIRQQRFPAVLWANVQFISTSL